MQRPHSSAITVENYHGGLKHCAVRRRLQRAGLVVHVIAESFVDLSTELARLRDGETLALEDGADERPRLADLSLLKSRDFH